jgi:hypothetical protein
MRLPRTLTVLGITAVLVDEDPTSRSTDAASGTVGTEPVPDAGSNTDDDRFPDVVAAEAAYDDGGTWSFAVTISSPYDSPARYADGWRVIGPDGEVYGTHTLTHDHANEQPFTRTQRGVEIPDDVDEVTIEGRDQVNGFGGATVVVQLVRG